MELTGINGQNAERRQPILLAEHDLEIRQQLCELLQSLGYNIIEVTDGHDILACCQHHQPVLALIDADLPNLDDLSICGRLRVRSNGFIPAALIVNGDDDAQVQAAVESGAVDLIDKPLKLAVLRYRLRALLQRMTRERERERQLERYRITSDLVSDYTYQLKIDDQGHPTLQWIVGGFQRVTGYTQWELLENGWQIVIHPDDLDVLHERRQRALQGESVSGELRIRTKAGETRWVRDHIYPTFDDDEQRVITLNGVAQDITDAREAQVALQRSEERYRIISSVISDYAYAYAVTDEGTLIKEWVTDAFSRIIGFDPSRASEEGFIKFIHPDDLPITEQRSQKLLDGEPDVSEFRIVTNNGDVRWIRDHGYPVLDETRGRVVRLYGAAQDITEERETHESLRRYTRDLKARNNELDAFAHTVAHDLKNPLASMMGFASVVDTYYDRMNREEIKEHMQLIMESVFKMRSIINSLLLLAGVNKMEEVEREPLDMPQIIEDAQRGLNFMIQEQQAEIHLPEEWPAAVGYTPWIEEVWSNYISNAIKYGGRPPQVYIGADHLPGDRVRFWVRDNGEGLTTEQQQKLFTPFTRVSQIKIDGHGLGLSVVHRIIERLDGEVGVESEVGQGSVFYFTLPAYTGKSQNARTAAAIG